MLYNYLLEHSSLLPINAGLFAQYVLMTYIHDLQTAEKEDFSFACL